MEHAVRFFHEHFGRHLAEPPKETHPGECCGSGLPLVRLQKGVLCLGCYSISRQYRYADREGRLGTAYNDVVVITEKHATLIADIIVPKLPKRIEIIPHEKQKADEFVMQTLMKPPADRFLIGVFTRTTALREVLRMSSRSIVYVCGLGSIGSPVLKGVVNRPIYLDRVSRGLGLTRGFGDPKEWIEPLRILTYGDTDDMVLQSKALVTIGTKYEPKYPDIFKTLRKIPPYGSPEYHVIRELDKLARQNA